MVLNVSKVASNSSAGAPGIGHERALVDDRSKATQSLMLAPLLERALGPGLQPLVREDPDGDAQASALPYKTSRRLQAFSAAGSL